jgi:hypothetical protein
MNLPSIFTELLPCWFVSAPAVTSAPKYAYHGTYNKLLYNIFPADDFDVFPLTYRIQGPADSASKYGGKEIQSIQSSTSS